jgi:RND family efflux transporter MFP subunit
MKRTITLVVATGLVVSIISSCSKKAETKVAERTISVAASIVNAGNMKVTRSYTGSLEGEKQAVIYAKISEAVQKINVAEGQSVKSDDILLTLDKNGPSSNYQQALSLYQNAEKTYNKMKYLYEQGAVSETQYDEAKTNYEVTKASYESAAQLVEIHSPITGVVTSLDVSAGDYVMVGTKLATVATSNQLRVKFGVNSSEIRFFTIGTPVTISAEGVAGFGTGKVTSVATSADPTSRAFEIEATIDNSDHYFRPGMFATIEFAQQHLDNVIVIPMSAVLTYENRPIAFVSQGGTAHQRSLVLGPENKGEVVVDSGLTVGDTLVTMGQQYLDEGFKVKITSMSEGVQ